MSGWGAMEQGARDPFFATRYTTRAIGPDGHTVYFDDLVTDGETVTVGHREMIVRYDPNAPDWFVEDK